MTDTPAAANRWTWLTSLTPTIDGIAKAAMALLWVAIGAGGLAGYQAYNPGFMPHMMIQGADVPKIAERLPTPTAFEQAIYHYEGKFKGMETGLGDVRQQVGNLQQQFDKLQQLIVTRLPGKPLGEPASLLAAPVSAQPSFARTPEPVEPQGRLEKPAKSKRAPRTSLGKPAEPSVMDELQKWFGAGK